MSISEYVSGLNSDVGGIAVDLYNNNLFIAYRSSNNILIYKNVTDTLSVWSNPTIPFNIVENVVLTNRPNVYNSYMYAMDVSFIYVLDNSGNKVAQYLDTRPYAAQFFGMLVDPTNNVYYGNALDNNIHKMEPNGTRSTYITSAGELAYPIGLAYDNQKNMYVTNALRNTIVKYNPGGVLVNATFIQSMDTSGQFLNIAIDSNNSIYTIYLFNGTTTLYKYDINGNLLSTILSYSTSDPYRLDRGLTIDSANNVYVVRIRRDRSSASIMKWSPTIPVSDICFIAGTMITTDQGDIPIEQIDPHLHTIGSKNIVRIVKTVLQDPYLVCFEKGSLSDNIPNQKTIVSKNHLLYFDGTRRADDCVDRYNHVYRVKYNRQPVYNVLMKTHETMLANNIPCETLSPLWGTLFPINLSSYEAVTGEVNMMFPLKKQCRRRYY